MTPIDKPPKEVLEELERSGGDKAGRPFLFSYTRPNPPANNYYWTRGQWFKNYKPPDYD